VRWGTVTAFVRESSALTLVALIAAIAIVAGIVAGQLQRFTRSPLEQARALADRGAHEEAERAYLDLAEAAPDDVALLLELLDQESRVDPDEEDQPDKATTALPPVRDSRLAALLARLPPDAALVTEYWRRVLHYAADDTEHARIVAAADREPPVAWANDVLAREDYRAGDPAAAARRFAREAQAFAGRHDDARVACELWRARGDWASVDRARADARFERQLRPGDRMDLASARGQWAQALRWVIPAEWERATVGIVLLATLSAAVWFAICSRIGSPMPTRRRLRLHASALGLGVVSAYVTIGLYVAEVGVFRSLGSHDAGAEILDCLFGVGPREEIAKAVCALPVLLWIRRHGERRDALACGGLVGLGFAAVENLRYFEEGPSTALARFVTANLLHVAATGLVAASIDDALRGRSTKGNSVGWTLAFVAVMHGLYDVVLLAARARGLWKVALIAMLFFWLVTRSFLSAVREQVGRDWRLDDAFVVGMGLVTAGSFVYGSALLGTKAATVAVVEGLAGTILVFGMVMDQLGGRAR
jgi:RsiW-degrading membrane proteinase PrsW (M82 family)